ncbi:hypothetical protein LCGC14_1354560 [marine sediment metagenome]|uniref:Uncharacterized protein n=1 Tax=marine sediment metagenome TaxID=412755 RepID=A0A0F9KAK8_9ZZZZ
MQVDVNNTFNSAEDRVQYALGSMDAFSIMVEHTFYHNGANYPGIIALSPAEALIKFLKHCPKAAEDNTIQVNLCE